MKKITARIPDLPDLMQNKKVLSSVMGKNILPLLAFVALPYTQAQAQTCSSASAPCVYSVKFICGVQSAISTLRPPSEPPVKPGNYATAINIHNYHLDQIANIVKTAVIANPENARSLGQISPPRTFTLPPGRAFEVDCSDIVALFGTVTPPLPAFIKGFVELRAPSGSLLPLLSVTGVYTAQQAVTTAAPSGPVSIEVVPVQPFPGP
jgi:hypothetical protein